MDKKSQKLLRVPQAAERLAVRESTIRKMIFQKRLPVVRIGRVVAIPENFIEELILKGYSPAIREAR
ncbi:MAG: helix-turn-helix domain-containing protein [Nitrospiria bacterium]